MNKKTTKLLRKIANMSDEHRRDSMYSLLKKSYKEAKDKETFLTSMKNLYKIK